MRQQADLSSSLKSQTLPPRSDFKQFAESYILFARQTTGEFLRVHRFGGETIGYGGLCVEGKPLQAMPYNLGEEQQVCSVLKAPTG